MKLKSYWILLIFVAIACNSGNKKKEGSSPRIYQNEELGWMIKVPKGWDIVMTDSILNLSQEDQEALAENMGQSLDYSEVKPLISFQKDPYNAFVSTAEPFEEEYEGQYLDVHHALNDMLYTTYTSQGAKIDTLGDTENIGGKDFEVFKIAILGPNGEAILNQAMYSTLWKGHNFSISLSYNKEENFEEMMEAFQNSSFE